MTEETYLNYPPDAPNNTRRARTDEEQAAFRTEAVAYFTEHGGVTDRISAWSDAHGVLGYRTVTVASWDAHLLRCDKSPETIAKMICRQVNRKLHSIGAHEELLPTAIEEWIQDGIDPTDRLVRCALWSQTKKEVAA